MLTRFVTTRRESFADGHALDDTDEGASNTERG